MMCEINTSSPEIIAARAREAAAEDIFKRIVALPKKGNTYQVHVADLLEIVGVYLDELDDSNADDHPDLTERLIFRSMAAGR